MLVLTRKTNQSIMIGDDIEVSVLAVSRDKIRLGISAPKDVRVYRKEVFISIQDEAGSPEEGAESSSKNGSENGEASAERVAEALERAS